MLALLPFGAAVGEDAVSSPEEVLSYWLPDDFSNADPQTRRCQAQRWMAGGPKLAGNLRVEVVAGYLYLPRRREGYFSENRAWGLFHSRKPSCWFEMFSETSFRHT